MAHINNKIVIVTSKSLTLNLFYKNIIDQLKINNYSLYTAVTDIENNSLNCKTLRIYLPSKITDLFNPFKLFYYFYKTRSLIKKYNEFTFVLNTPLVAHIFRISSLFLKVNFIYFVHGYRFHKNSNIFLFIFFFLIEYFLSIKTSKYININQYDYKITNKYFKKKSYFINGVGVNLEIKNKYKNLNLTKFIEKKFIIGVISAYRKNKGYNQLLLLAKKLQKNNILINCYGYDDPTMYKKIAVKNKLTNIYFNKFTYNIENKILNFDIFLHLSEREGLPVSLLQCLKLGVPSVVKNIRGCNDLVINDFNGIILNNNVSADEIYSKIINIYLDFKKLKYYSENAYKSISKKYSKSYISKQFLEILND